MRQSIRTLAASAVLLVSLVPAAFAGGAHAKVTRLEPDGRTYRVNTYLCQQPASARVTAWAEGLVDGKRQTLPLKINKTAEVGVFQFARNWPEQGEWVIRVRIGGSQGAVSLTALDEKGAIRTNRLIFDGDGKQQCDDILAQIASGEDDC